MRDLPTDHSPRRPLPPLSDHLHATKELPGDVERMRITVELPGRRALSQEFPVRAGEDLEISCLPAVEATCEARVTIEAPGQGPIVQTLVMFIAIVVVLSNLFVDLLYGMLDPRVRYAS